LDSLIAVKSAAVKEKNAKKPGEDPGCRSYGDYAESGAEGKIGSRPKAALKGHAKFPRDRDLAPARQRPRPARRTREFLLFAQGRGGYSFEQTPEMFLTQIGRRGGIQPWPIQQAADTVRACRCQYRDPSGDGEGGGWRSRLQAASTTMGRAWSAFNKSSACDTTPGARRNPSVLSV